MKILFVCTGNTCRSAMAAAIAKNEYPELEFDSAGLAAETDSKASQNAVLALAEKGIDLSTHRSKQLTADIAQKADLIVPMTMSHASFLLSCGIDKNRIILPDIDVCDPYGGDLDIYRSSRDQLYALVKKVCENL